MRILSLGLSDKWIYLIFERITELVSLVLTPTGTKAWSQSFFFLPLSISHRAVLIKRNRPWNLTGPLSWFIYQVYSAPEWWLCDGYPGGGLRSVAPPPNLPPSCSLAVASELTPDTGLSSGGTAQAPAPNEYRAGAAAAASSICENVTDQAIKHRQASFHIPTSSTLLCASDVALRCTSYPYATAVCLALGELSVTLPKPALQETPGNHIWMEQKNKKLPH